jgi:hypothetical protein
VNGSHHQRQLGHVPRCNRSFLAPAAWTGAALLVVIGAVIAFDQRATFVKQNPRPGNAVTMAASADARPTALLRAQAPSVNESRIVSRRSLVLVERLALPSTEGHFTAESALAWDDTLAKLVSLGTEAVPAIERLLRTRSVEKWDAGVRQVLRYESVREAMFEALLKIGGVDAQEVLASILADAVEPREVALLARNLELLAPGEYAVAAIAAATRSLEYEEPESTKTREVAPLFEVFSRLGGVDIAPLLEGTALRWSYYAAISLAQMPGGAGVPSLLRLAQEPTFEVAAEPAIRALASLAAKNEIARAAFLQLVRNDRIRSSDWSDLAPILAGEDFQFAAGVFGGAATSGLGTQAQLLHIRKGNQNFWMGPQALSASSSEQQLAWLDHLAAAATNPRAQAAIHHAWKMMSERLPMTTFSLK